MIAARTLWRVGRSGLAMAVACSLLIGEGASADPPDRESANPMCPVQPEEETDASLFTDYLGVRVYFCCKKCVKKFEKTPEPYVANLPVAMSAAIGRARTLAAGSSGASAAPEVVPAMAPHSHDHAPPTSDEPTASSPSPWVRRVGRLHPMVVHFPIALLLAAALAELLAMVTRSVHFAFAARFCLWTGSIGAVVAAALGWVAAQSFSGGEADADLLWVHRWLGVTTAVLALVALGACERAHRRDSPRWRWAYRATLGLGSLVVGAAGHWGAALVYGWDYLAG